MGGYGGWQAGPGLGTSPQLLQAGLSDGGRIGGPPSSEVGIAGQCGLFLSVVKGVVWSFPADIGGTLTTLLGSPQIC